MDSRLLRFWWTLGLTWLACATVAPHTQGQVVEPPRKMAPATARRPVRTPPAVILPENPQPLGASNSASPYSQPGAYQPNFRSAPDVTPPPAAPGSFGNPYASSSPNSNAGEAARTGAWPGFSPFASRRAAGDDTMWPPPEYRGPVVPFPTAIDDDDDEFFVLPPDDIDAWQFLPDGLMYPAYLAGSRESRLSAVFNYDKNTGWVWDSTIGGRAPLIRYGTYDRARPQGWQIDLEGAVFSRVDLESGRDLLATDYRFGVPFTVAEGAWQIKFGYYHLSSHLGDEFFSKNPTFPRINYSRDQLVLGLALAPIPSFRMYGETGWAFRTDGGSKPWEFQFGVEYSPVAARGVGTPFAAVHGRIREEVNFSGNVTAQAGWQWRGSESGHLLRIGGQYFNGKSEVYQFFRTHENMLGLGVWYDY